MKKIFLSIMICFFLSSQAWATPEILTVSGLSNVLTQHKGKIVLVNFFATWCPPCRQELPHLLQVEKKFGGNFVVIGVSVDENPDDVIPFIKKMKIDYPVYMTDQDLVRRFGVSSIPHNVIYGTDGKMKANHAGYVDQEILEPFINNLLDNQ